MSEAVFEFAVVGGGIAGLACAYDLARAGRDVVLLEADERVGGVIGSDRIESAAGSFLFERGPNTVQASARAFRTLCGDVGLADRLIASRADASRRWLFLRGRLRELPRGPFSFLASDLLSWRGKWALASEPLRRFRTPPANEDEATLARFFRERLGDEAATTLGAAFVRGVHAAELGELGARSAFPRLYESCARHGGIVRALWATRRERASGADLPGPAVRRTRLLSFPEGLGELPRALAAALGERVRAACAARELRSSSGSSYRLRCANGREFSARQVVLAVPAPIAARLLAGILEGEPAALARVAHARLTLVHLGLGAPAADRLPPGFGFLVPPAETTLDAAGEDRPLTLLGTIFAANTFDGRAPRGGAVTTSFYRTADLPFAAPSGSGTSAPPAEEQRMVLERTREDLEQVLGRELPATAAWRIQRWDDVIPRYAPGHAERIAAFAGELAAAAPRIHLTGNYLAGVGVEAVVGHARALAARLAAKP